jgi:phosphate-selective porin OprO and OprP
MKKVGGLLLAFVFLFCLSALPVLAADTDVEQLKGEVQKLLKKIEDLEKKQQESEKKFESVEKAATKLEQEEAKLKEEKKTRAVAYYKDGFFIETPDKRFGLQMGGVLHFDTRVFDSEKSAGGFDLRRARYDVRGWHNRGDIEALFRLQLEMADTVKLRNAYWMFKFMPELNVQIGQFKIPAGGADFLTEEAHVNFIEYAAPAPVAPEFDRGVMIHSSFLKGKISTAIGAFDGQGYDADVSGRADLDSNRDLAARALFVPFKDSDNKFLKGLHIAGDYQYGLESIKTTTDSRMRTENYESSWFNWKQSTVDIEKRFRYGGELHWLIGPLTASYEFNRVVWDDIQVFNSSGKWQADYSGENHVDVHSVWVSYFLTGEEKSFEDAFFCWRQPKPKKNFSLKDHTWGAWEVLARYVYHDASEDLFEGKTPILDGSNRGYTMTGGLRWIWNPKVRIMMDLNYLKSDDGKGIIVDRAGSKGATGSSYVDSETAFLVRFILTP